MGVKTEVTVGDLICSTSKGETGTAKRCCKGEANDFAGELGEMRTDVRIDTIETLRRVHSEEMGAVRTEHEALVLELNRELDKLRKEKREMWKRCKYQFSV